MNWILSLIISTAFATSLYAQDTVTIEKEELPTAIVHKVIGVVTLDGSPLKAGDLIEKNGLIETKEKSLIQLKIALWNNSISIGPTSKMALNFSDEKKYTLEKGICRWKSELQKAINAENKGKIYTKNIAMGVRGTDFLVKSFPLFGESEIIMLDGVVQMENLEDPSNIVVVNKGQWGGLGGRYGKKINPPLDLPAEVLNTFKNTIEAP